MAPESPPLLKYCGQVPSSRILPQIVFVQVRKCSTLPSRFSRLSSSPQTLKDSKCPPSSPRILKVISRLQDAQNDHDHDVRLGWRRRRAACEAQGRPEITTVCHPNPTLLNAAVTKALEFAVPAAAQGWRCDGCTAAVCHGRTRARADEWVCS
ncbi:hypothetical protein C8R45DRAFT_560886 [Mycena sanguinolenta]|nr:hypothetical protein C8R45DRAFT_560886 [Mycena sanguinolenta]